MHHQRVKACEAILDAKLDEYLKTHEEWHAKGYLCPHKGDPRAHAKMDEIIHDVKQAHDMLHAAMRRAGHEGYELPNGNEALAPSHAKSNPY